MSLRAENAVSGVIVTNCSMLCSLACKNILVRITDPVDAVVDIPRTVVVVLPCVGRYHFLEVCRVAELQFEEEGTSGPDG